MIKLVAKMLKSIHNQESKKAAREKAKAVVEETAFHEVERGCKEGGEWH